MLRITEITKDARSRILLLEGRVVDEWVLELRRVCDLIQGQNIALTLDLDSVDFADAAGVALLKELAARKARLVNCSEFLRQLLQEECPCEKK